MHDWGDAVVCVDCGERGLLVRHTVNTSSCLCCLRSTLRRGVTTFNTAPDQNGGKQEDFESWIDGVSSLEHRALMLRLDVANLRLQLCFL